MSGLSFNVKKARIILVGVSHYTKKISFEGERTYHNIPELDVVVERLKETFLNTMPGLSDEQIKILDPESPEKFIDELNLICQENDLEFILLYYTGHGQKRSNQFFLTLKNNTFDAINSQGNHYANLNFYRVSEALGNTAKKAKKLIILDCCYSEKAFAKLNMEGGTGIIVSCKSGQKSYEGLFTDKWIEALEDGLEHRGYLTVGEIYDRIPKELKHPKSGKKQERASRLSRELGEFVIAKKESQNSSGFLVNRLKINRQEQMDALDKLKRNEESPLKIAIIHGKVADKHDSLIERFIKHLSKDLSVENQIPLFYFPKDKASNYKNLLMKDFTNISDWEGFKWKIYEYFLENTHGNRTGSGGIKKTFYAYNNAKDAEKAILKDILKERHESVIISNIKVNFEVSKLDILLHYINNFWDLNELRASTKQVYIFINIFYSSSPNKSKRNWRFWWKKSSSLLDEEDLREFIKKVQCNKESDKPIAVLVPKLNLVTADHIELLLNNYITSDAHLEWLAAKIPKEMSMRNAQIKVKSFFDRFYYK